MSTAPCRALVLASLAAVPALAQAAAEEVYNNARFEFSVGYDPHQLVPKGESANGDGMTWRSPDGRTELRAWGAWEIPEWGLKESCGAVREELKQAGMKVALDRRTREFYAISGSDGTTILYQYGRRKGDALVHVRISYPAAQRGRWDPCVKRLVQGLQ